MYTVQRQQQTIPTANQNQIIRFIVYEELMESHKEISGYDDEIIKARIHLIHTYAHVKSNGMYKK